MSPQTPRSIDDNYPCGSVVDHKPTNKMSGFPRKEEASVIKTNNDIVFMKDPSKVVDLNVCINNQNEVSSNTKNDTDNNKIYDCNSSVKNIALTAGNEESSNKAKHDIVVES